MRKIVRDHPNLGPGIKKTPARMEDTKSEEKSYRRHRLDCKIRPTCRYENYYINHDSIYFYIIIATAIERDNGKNVKKYRKTMLDTMCRVKLIRGKREKNRGEYLHEKIPVNENFNTKSSNAVKSTHKPDKNRFCPSWVCYSTTLFSDEISRAGQCTTPPPPSPAAGAQPYSQFRDRLWPGRIPSKESDLQKCFVRRNGGK